MNSRISVEEMEDENKKRSLQKILKELAETSALHGIPKIASSRQLAVKVMWCILVLSAVGVMTFQLVELFQTFYSNPVQTTVSLDFSTLQFPAVTICNMNPVRKSKLGESPELLNQLFPRRGRTKPTSTPQRHKRNQPKPVDDTVFNDTFILSPDYELRETEPDADVFYDDNLRDVLRHFNVSTIEELVKLLANGSGSPNGQLSVTLLPNGTYVYTFSSTEPEKDINAEHTNATTDDVRNVTETGSGITNATISPLNETNSTPIDFNQTEILSDMTSVSEINQTTDVFNISEINQTTDSLIISEITTMNPFYSSEIIPTVDLFSTIEIHTENDAINISASSTSPSMVFFNTSEESPSQPPEWFDYVYEHFDWDIFHDTDTNETDNYTLPELAEDLPKSIAKHLRDPKDKWDQIKTDFKTTFRRVNIDTRKFMGHQLLDFIQYASFAKRQQEVPTYFEPFTTATFGNCYTMDNSKFKSWRSGPETGIKLTLNLEVDEYVESFSSGYGVRIVFHEPGTFPMPAEEGLTISPGYETSIGLRAINVTRLGQPYGDCTDQGSEQFQRKYNITYSKTACLEFCRIENVISHCQCIPIDAPDIDFGTEVPVCDSKDEICAFEVEYMFEEGTLHCDCINPCWEFVYAKTISGRAWPHRDFLEKVLMKDMCEKNLPSLQKACRQVNSDTEEFNYDRYRNNFVRVLIYFEDLNYQKITEEPFYTTVRFICDIGGAMGLFIGVSILSLFEVLQLMLEIVLYLLDRRLNRDQTNGLVDKNSEC